MSDKQMKKYIFIILLLLLPMLTGCVLLNQKQFIAKLQEGEYINEEYLTSNDTINSFKMSICFKEGNRMQYVKNYDNMIKDLYTVNEKFYDVYEVRIKITINEVDYYLSFERINSVSKMSTNKYFLNDIKNNNSNPTFKPIKGLEKIYFTIIDDDGNQEVETINCELIFKDEKDNVSTKLNYRGNDFKLQIIDQDNVCTFEDGFETEMTIQGGEYIIINFNRNIECELYYSITNDEITLEYYLAVDKIEYQCDYQDSIITIYTKYVYE